MRKNLINSYILIGILLLAWSQQVDQCSSSSATFYDGYLDPFIYYGQFQRSSNSYYQFTNPYKEISPLNKTTISFWAKIPSLSSSGSLQTGRFLDCSDIVSIRLINDTIRFQVAVIQNSDSTTNQLNVKQFSNDLTELQQWNNYAFSFNSGNQLMFFNGVLIGEQTLSTSILTSTSSNCRIGNSISSDDPLTGYIRHFYMSTSAWTSSTNITNLIHHKFLPSDSSMLKYFRFSSSFLNNDQYFYDSDDTYISSGLKIAYSNEPEFVCYCSGTQGLFLNMSSDFKLKSIDLTAGSSYSFDTSGFYIDFLMYAQKQGSSNSDQVLFTITNYAQIVLTNNSQTLRVDIISSTITGNVTFTPYQFRYNQWTWITIRASRAICEIWVDGQSLYSERIRVTFADNAQYLQVESPSTISFMLKNITVRNYRSEQIANIDFSYQNLNSKVVADTGSLKFGYSNSLCYSTVANTSDYWNGINCRDRRLFAQFNNATSTSSTNRMQNSIKSSYANMTIEMWIKDLVTTSSSTSIFFQNSRDGTNGLVTMSITSGASTSATRRIQCFPQATTYSSQRAQIQSVTTYNTWIHYACISNTDTNSVTTIFHSSTNTSSASDLTATLSGYSFYQSTSDITTVIGSDLNSTSKFRGYIRELRIWSTALSQSTIQIYRYSEIDSSTNPYSDYLIYYYLLSNSLNSISLADSETSLKNFAEQSSSTQTVKWVEDKSLVICQPGYFFDGQCCVTFDISNANFIIDYSSSQNKIQVYLNSSSVNSPLFDTLSANFSVYSVKNDFFYTTEMQYSTYLKQYFDQNQTASYSFPSINIDPLAYSVTIQAIIYSSFSSTTQVTKYQTLTFQCPILWLTILDDTAVDTSQIVSKTSTDKQPVINTNLIDTCYNATSLSTYSYNFTSFQWSSNVTVPSFSTLFTLSSDNLTATAISSKESIIGSNATYMQVSIVSSDTVARKVLTNQIYLYFQSLKITTGLTTTSVTKSLTFGDPLSIDLTSSVITPSNSGYSLSFSVACPTQAFYTTTDYSDYCVISSTGKFEIADTSVLYVVSDYSYYFLVTMNIEGTSILSTYLTTITFIKNGGTTNCPRLEIQSSYTFYINQTDNLQILPDPYLQCNTTSYSVSTVTWTVTDATDNTPYGDILDFGSQTIYRFANITPSVVSQGIVKAGQIFNIETIFTLTDQTKYTATTQVTFSQNLLQPVIQVYDQTGSLISDNTIPFLEEYFVVNASASYDPDDLNATDFTYSWTCPDIVLANYSCSTFISGSTNQFLYINSYQKAKINFSFNTEYTFSVTMSSQSNIYKTPVTKSIKIKFDPPSKYDATNNVNMNTDLVSVSAQGGVIYNTGQASYPKALSYNVNNYTEQVFNVITSNTNSQSTTSTVNSQIMFIYIFNEGFFPENDPMVWMFEQNGTNVKSSHTFQYNLSYAFDLVNKNISFQTYIQANIYYYTVRNGETNTVYLTIDTFYIYRNYADLVAQFVNSAITVDKYNNLVLNASASYDPDNLGLTYTYTWTCPVNSLCSNVTSSVLTLTNQARAQNNINSNTTNYQYSVQMSDGTRTSNIAIATVTIVYSNNYTDCVKITLSTDELNSIDSSKILTVEYAQTTPINIKMTITTYCDATNMISNMFNITSPAAATSIKPWKIETLTPTVATLYYSTYSSNLQAAVLYTVQFNQTFYMGTDTTPIYIQTNQFYLQRSKPELSISVLGPRIFQFSSTDTQFTLYGNKSTDPMSLTFTKQWNCPSYFGGDNCSQSLDMTLTYSALNALVTAAGSSMSGQYDKSHPFTLLLNSSDGVRIKNYTFYVYLPSSDSSLTNSYQNCGIYSSYSQYPPVKYYTNFYFNCSDSQAKTSEFQSKYTMKWSIAELNGQSTYFTYDNDLYLIPYAQQHLTQDYATVSVTLTEISATFYYFIHLVKKELVTGTAVLSPSTSLAYSTVYSLNLTNFNSTFAYGVQTQLRRHLSTHCEVLLSVKPLNDHYEDLMYSQMIFDSSSTYYLDFFDMNFVYMGSYDLTSNVLANITSASMQQSTLENLLSTYSNYSASSYSSTNSSRSQFQNDYFLIQMLSEVISKDKVEFENGVSTTSMKNQYNTQILTYITNTFSSIGVNFNSLTNTYDIEAEIILYKKIIYTIQNVLSSTVSLSDYTLFQNILTVLNTVYGYYTTIISFGNDQYQIRSDAIQILYLLNTQAINQFNTDDEIQTLASFQDQIKALYKHIVSSYTTGTTQGTITSKVQGSLYVSILNVNQTGSSKTMPNGFNSNEYVLVADQTTLFSTYGVYYLESTFAYVTNSSSPVETVIFINAYDTDSYLLNINFDTTSARKMRSLSMVEYMMSSFIQPQKLVTSTDIKFYIEVKSDFQTLFATNTTTISGTTQTVEYYEPYCVYYDEATQDWSKDGISTINYDNSTGIIECSTTHLSQFTVDYYHIITTSQITEESIYYFVRESTQYYIIVGCVPAVIILLVLVSAKQFTSWDYNTQKISSNKQNYGLCQIVGSSMLLFHPIISAFIGPTRANINCTITKIHKMINLWLSGFTYCFTVLMLNYFWEDPDIEPQWEKFMILGAIMVGGVLILRMILNTVVSVMFFKDARPPEQVKVFNQQNPNQKSDSESLIKKSDKKNKNVKPEEESLISSSTLGRKKKSSSSNKSVKKYKKSKSKQIKEKYDFQMEGGSSEEEKKMSPPVKRKKKTKSSSKNKDIEGHMSDNNSGKVLKKKKKKVVKKSDNFQDSSPLQSRAQSKNKKGSDFMGFQGHTAINDTTSGGEMSYSKNIARDSTDMPLSKRKINDSNVRGGSPIKNFKNDSDSESRQFKSQANMKNKGPSSFINVNENYQSQQNPQFTSLDKKKKKKKKTGLSKDKYSSDDEKLQNRFQTGINKKYGINDSVGSSINSQNMFKPNAGQDSVAGKSNRSKGKNGSAERSLKGKSTRKPDDDVRSVNSKISQKSNLSSKKRLEDQAKKGPKPLEDTKSPHYSGLGIIITILKVLILLGFIGVSLWLMRYIQSYDTVIDWIEIFCGAFCAQIFVIDTIFILIFSLFFKCTGPGGCARVMGMLFLGNLHPSCINSLVYDLDNKIAQK